MTKIRIKIEVEIEYEPNPENYPEESRTPEGMLAVDLECFEDDPAMVLYDTTADWKITGEVIDT